MKIGLPRLRLSRKLLIITLGVTVLLGGTGVTALYFGGKDLIMNDGTSAIGAECTDIQTMVQKTPSNHLWLRRFIRMENASGQERVRTALRIAGLLAQKNAVDLVHVSVLDTHGPDKRAFMRERAIGAEVLIALKPDNLPDMKSPAMASYYEGPVSAEGRYYGDKVIVDIEEIRSMMTAMRTVEEKPDCVSSVKEGEEDAKANEHGAKDKKEGHETKKNDHGEKPAEEHGEKPAEDHGEKPAAENADGEQPAKEQSFMDSMLGMVGLGGSDEAAPEDHAPAESADHAKAEKPVKEQSFLDGMLGMVGLGGSEEVAPVNQEPVAEEPEDAASEPGAKEHSAADETAPANHEKTPAATADHAAEDADTKPADDGHGAQDDAARATVTPEEHGEKPDTNDAEPAKDGHPPEEAAKESDGQETPSAAQETDGHGAKDAHAASADDGQGSQDDASAKAEGHGDKPAEHEAKPVSHEEAPAEDPAQSEEHANPKKPKSDDHAEAVMPVGD